MCVILTLIFLFCNLSYNIFVHYNCLFINNELNVLVNICQYTSVSKYHAHQNITGQQHVIRECVKNSSAIFSIKEHESTHNVSNGTARTDLLTLVKDGVLQKSKQGNRWIFSPVPNLTKRLIKTSGDKVTQQGSEQLVEFVESETPVPPPPPQDINISDANLS